MKNLQVKIEWKEKAPEGMSIIASPYSFKCEFNEDRTNLYYQFPYLLEIWAKQIVEMRFPNYKISYVKATVIN
jgi:hypothetical protein